MILLGIFGLGIWIYFLTVFHRAGTRGFAYLWGSSGLLAAMMIFIRPLIEEPVISASARFGGILGELLGICSAYPEEGLIWIYHDTHPTAFYIDYECGGVLEILIFTSLLWFFPLYRVGKKFLLEFLGILWILSASSVRIGLICILVSLCGSEVFYFSNIILGRIIYFLFSVALYFYLFTVPQIQSMKRGGVRYDAGSV